MNQQLKNDDIRLQQLCTNLLNYRSQVDDKEEFSRTVIKNVFVDKSLDLLLLRPKTDPTIEDAYNQLLTLVGINSMVFKVVFF